MSAAISACDESERGLKSESPFRSNRLFRRMILSETSATFRDHAPGSVIGHAGLYWRDRKPSGQGYIRASLDAARLPWSMVTEPYDRRDMAVDEFCAGALWSGRYAAV